VTWDALPLAWAAILLSRSRKWDWLVVAVAAATLGVRLATQLVR
jgi:hypothetical protein